MQLLCGGINDGVKASGERGALNWCEGKIHLTSFELNVDFKLRHIAGHHIGW